MLRKLLILFVVIMTGLLCAQGCKKSSPESRFADEIFESAEDYADEYAEEAELEIDDENMADELEKIEDEVELEEIELP